MSMTRYIHIGYPKCASTALQKSFFSKHPELFHLGANAGGTAAPYLNTDVQTAIDVSLRFEREAAYDAERNQQIFETAFLEAENSGKRAVGISSESLSLMISHDIDTAEKARRLHALFGDDTRIVFIIREQWSFIKSIYRELVLCGLHLSYDAFVKNIYYNQARNFLLDLNYLATYHLYCNLFGGENVLLLPYEWLKVDASRLMIPLQQHLDVTPLVSNLPHANKRASDSHVEAIRRLNNVFRLNCSRSPFEPFMAFRFPTYFEQQLEVAVPESVVADEQFITGISQIRNGNVLPYEVEPVSYYLSKQFADKMDELFRNWNDELAKQTGIALGELGYGVT